MKLDFSQPAPRVESLDPQALQELLDALWQKVGELEERLGLNSRNSSKPPSGDGIGGGQRKKRQAINNPGEKRRRGGQPGHEGKTRAMLPTEQVDVVVNCPPPEQCDCGGTVQPAAKDPRRHQVFEMPEIRPHVTEYQILSGCCAACGKLHDGVLPNGVPMGMLGPRMMAWTSALVGIFRLSRRQVQRLLDCWMNMEVCLGTLSNAERKVSEALSASVEEAKAHVKEQASVNVDETGHRQAGTRMYLWVAVTSLVSVFLVRLSRGSEVAKEILGKGFSGIVGSDRWSGYTWVDPLRRQVCWAHLIRDFIRISERGGEAGQIGNELLDYVRQMFALWRRVRDGTLDRRQVDGCMQLIRVGIETTLHRGTWCGNAKTQGTCEKILSLKHAMWTFITVPGIEPTNNAAERTLRDYVIWRKICLGTQSERGNLFVERLMTVSASCKQQGRDTVEFITRAVQADLQNLPAPSLLHNH